jgi:hypothetical protein
MSTYIGKLSFLSSDKFLDKIQNLEHPNNDQVRLDNSTSTNLNLRIAIENWDYLKALLIRLETLYKETFVSYKDRITFVEKVGSMRNYVEICSRVKLELEFLEDYRD